MKTLRPLFVILLAMTVSCSNVPLTGRKQFTAIPSSQMLALSADSYSQVLSENQVSDNTTYIAAVNRVGKNVVAAVEEYLAINGLEARTQEFDWRFNVLKSEELNAWCMPGGQIAFYEGIMPICGDDNGIAIVMAHEIAHAVAKHGNERLSQQLLISMGGVALSEALETEKETTQQLALLAFGVGTQLGVSLPYSRTHESEADELGLYFMAMAGYDPRMAPVFWERMEQAGGARPPEFLSTHPDPLNRIQQLHELMPKAMEYYNAAQ